MNGLKLGHKLIGLFLFMAMIVAITGIFGILSLNKVGHTIQDVIVTGSTQSNQVVLMKTALQECRLHLAEAAMATKLDDLDIVKGDYESKRDRFNGYVDLLLKGNPKLGLPPATKGSQLEQRTLTAAKTIEEFSGIADKLFMLKETQLKKGKAGLGDPEIASILRTDLPEKTDVVIAAVDEMLITVNGMMTQANKTASSIQQKAEIALVVVMACAILLAILFGTLATRNIVGRVRKMGAALAEGAKGNLAVTVSDNSTDEIGTLVNDFNQMLLKLSEMVNKVKRSISELGLVTGSIREASLKSVSSAELQAENTIQTSSAITEMNSSINGVALAIDGLSLSASESTSSTMQLIASIEEVTLNVESLSQAGEEVSSSISEMAASIRAIDGSVASLVDASMTTASSVAAMDSSIKQIEQSATYSVTISDNLLIDAESGKKSVEATIAGMSEIKRSSIITSEVISTLSEKASDIGSILSVIDEVAEQTNLLALNAAIIAAQAGEHGKGFAVVAEEIKELADRTSSSTKEIAAVVTAVQLEVRRAVDSIDLAKTSIADGEQLSHQSGEALVKILAGVRTTSKQLAEIAGTTESQSRESQQIKGAVDRISEMITQIATATGQQGRGADMIIAAVEKMKGLNAQVRNSTREQSTVGVFIGKSTENINSMIRKIKLAIDEQSRSSALILQSADEIQKSTEMNLETNRVADEAVNRLSRQSDLINQEMNKFVINLADN